MEKLAKVTKPKKTLSSEEEKAENDTGPRPKLRCLIISNFRAIGRNPIAIDLDDIVVLVGPNNAGKSSILKAYQIVMAHGSSEGRLGIQDFPNEKVDPDNLPTIILATEVVDENRLGTRWITVEKETGRKIVRERWVWPSP